MDEYIGDLQDVINQLSGLTISDGASGTIRKKKGDTAAVCCTEVSHYALALPEEQGQGEGGALVFDSLKQALVSLKRHKGGRLKGFPTKEEALLFASTPVAGANASTNKNGGRSSSVTPQLLVQLRKNIERGETESFLRKVFENPKVLVGESDIPSILQEGTHVNALHISAKCNNPIICQLLLNILENRYFLERIYPHENFQAIEKRRTQLLDFYLNTPEKCLGETPLHYAAKFGSVGCVKILVAHPLCIPDRKNIHGKTAEEITCTRVKPSELFKADEILEAFRNVYYVTILRDDNLISPPIVSKPSLKRNIVLPSEDGVKFASNSCLKIKAFAGPMDMEKASAFYQLLKNPSLATPCFETKDLKLLQEIRKSDPVKGFERIARLMAEDVNTEYMEYYSFLNAFANVSKEEGLQALEQYFKSQCGHPDKHLAQAVDPEDLLEMVHLKPHAHVNALGHDINVYLKKECSPLEETFFTPPSSPELEDEFFLAQESVKPSHDEDLFIEGFQMTRLDVDVLLAMQDVHVDEEAFPAVHSWKSRVEEKLREYQDDHHKMKALTPLASVSVPRIPRTPKWNADPALKRKLF